MQMKLRMTPEQVLEQAVKAVRWACEYTDDVEFSPEDAGRSDIQCLLEVIDRADDGAATVNVPDTVGYTMPRESAAMFGSCTGVADLRAVVFRALSRRSGGGGGQLAGGREAGAARSSARSTASASARATRRWRRSSCR